MFSRRWPALVHCFVFPVLHPKLEDCVHLRDVSVRGPPLDSQGGGGRSIFEINNFGRTLREINNLLINLLINM